MPFPEKIKLHRSEEKEGPVYLRNIRIKTLP